MALIGGLLARSRPSVTTAVQVLEVGKIPLQVTRIFVANTTNSNARFSVWHRTSAGTPTDADALWKAVNVAGQKSFVGPEGELLLLRPGDLLFFASSVGNALTFSVYGRSATTGVSRGVADIVS